MKIVIPSEYDIQCAIFSWASFKERQFPCLKLLYATASGIRIPIGLVMKAKKCGIIKKGLCDIVLPAARGNYHGLYIELKRDQKSKTSKEQLEFMAMLCSEVYRATVCAGFDASIAEIENYITMEKGEMI